MRRGGVIKSVGGLLRYVEVGIGEVRRRRLSSMQAAYQASEHCADLLGSVEKLRQSLLARSVNAIDAGVEQLRHNAISLLQQEQVPVYATVGIIFSVSSICVFEMIWTSIRRRSEERRSKRRLKLGESRPSLTLYEEPKTSWPHGSWKGRRSCRWVSGMIFVLLCCFSFLLAINVICLVWGFLQGLLMLILV